MKLRLSESIVSPQDLQAVIMDIRQYAKWFGHTAVKKRLQLGNAAQPPAISPAALELIKEWGGDEELSQAKLDELIAGLTDLAGSAPRLSITLAAPPPAGLKKSLAAWCRQNVDPGALVSFSFDSTLLGGLVLRYGSHIFDWSFRRQILDNRSKFPEVLRRV